MPVTRNRSDSSRRSAEPVTACILAGGRGGRIGGDKCGKILGGRRLIDYALELAGRLVEAGDTDRTVVAGGRNDLDTGDTEVLEDIAGVGPMAGLHACMVRYGRTLLFPCDMPFLNEPFLRSLIRKSLCHDIVTCRMGGLVQPQVGVFSGACLEALEDMIGQERYSLFRMVKECGLRVLVVEEEEVAEFGDPARIFLNINTNEELRRAERTLSG